jgi:hypothetical protein
MRTADEHGALPPVLAGEAMSSGGYRLRWAAEWVRERFWVIPAVLLAFGLGLAVLIAQGPGPLGAWGGYGIFIPVFFVASGMTLDIAGIARNPARVIVFFALLLVIRGLPSLLVYRKALRLRQWAEMTFITATALPLLVALAEIGLRDGKMLPANAAALVGAGVLSVLVFPAVAAALASKGGAAAEGAAPAAELAPQAPHPADHRLPWHR